MQSLAIGVAIPLKVIEKVQDLKDNKFGNTHKINRQPYKGLGFGDKGAPELPPYRSKTDNDIQELFDIVTIN